MPMDRERESRVSRRALLTASAATLAGTGLAAAPMAVGEACASESALSARIAELKRDFDEAAREEEIASRMADAGGPPEWAAWEERWDTLCAVSFAIMAEPVWNAADFRLKAAVWDRTCKDPEADIDDMDEHSGWMDRASLRLLNDARKLLGAVA